MDRCSFTRSAEGFPSSAPPPRSRGRWLATRCSWSRRSWSLRDYQSGGGPRNFICPWWEGGGSGRSPPGMDAPTWCEASGGSAHTRPKSVGISDAGSLERPLGERLSGPDRTAGQTGPRELLVALNRQFQLRLKVASQLLRSSPRPSARGGGSWRYGRALRRSDHHRNEISMSPVIRVA